MKNGKHNGHMLRLPVLEAQGGRPNGRARLREMRQPSRVEVHQSGTPVSEVQRGGQISTGCEDEMVDPTKMSQATKTRIEQEAEAAVLAGLTPNDACSYAFSSPEALHWVSWFLCCGGKVK